MVILLQRIEKLTFFTNICISNHHENMSMKCIPPETPLLYRKTGVCRGQPIFFLILPQNIDCGYSLEPPRRDCVPTINVLSNNVKNSFFSNEIFNLNS